MLKYPDLVIGGSQDCFKYHDINKSIAYVLAGEVVATIS